MLKRKLCIIFITMFAFSLISYGFIAAFGRKTPVQGGGEKTILTSFFPVFLITRNLTEGMEGVRVANLTENHKGCLHDYQLTTKDMLLLETADLLVINGGGMELFVEQAARKLDRLVLLDSCEGMELLAGNGHDHDHGGEGDADAKYPDGEEAVHSPDEESLEESDQNGHVWMDINRYLLQVDTIADGLCAAFPEQAAVILENKTSYGEKLAAIAEECSVLREGLEGVPVVTFHDAFVYLCDSLGMEVVHGIDLDADSALSAGEIAALTDEIRLHGVRYLLAERGTDGIAEQVAGEAGCTVLYLDPLTYGGAALDTYLTTMRENLEIMGGILRN